MRYIINTVNLHKKLSKNSSLACLLTPGMVKLLSLCAKYTRQHVCQRRKLIIWRKIFQKYTVTDIAILSRQRGYVLNLTTPRYCAIASWHVDHEQQDGGEVAGIVPAAIAVFPCCML